MSRKTHYEDGYIFRFFLGGVIVIYENGNNNAMQQISAPDEHTELEYKKVCKAWYMDKIL